MITFDRPTVFALRALGLGDLLTAIPALRALRRAHPHHRLILGGNPGFGSLVARFGLADEVWPTDDREPLYIQFGPNDLAVNLHGRGPVSTIRLLEAEPTRIIAFAHPDIPATYGFADWKRDEHEVSRWCRLLTSWDIPADPSDLYLEGPAVTRKGVVVHPGASAPARMWPPDRWARLIRDLSAIGGPVLITGGAGEVPLAREIAREAGLAPSVVLAGQTSLEELAETIATARLLVCTDTGPAHLATAFHTPSVVLFGPTSPAHWGPPRGGPHRVLWRGTTGDPNGSAIHPGLAEISVAEVLGAAEECLAQSGTRSAAASRSATS